MKRVIYKTKNLLPIMLIIAVSALLSTCSGSSGGIYATIEREVKLNNRTINNIVYRMTQFGSTLYACNGELWMKGAGAGAGWTKISTDGVPGFIVSVAADSSHLYVLATSNAEATSPEFTVYTSTDGIHFTTTGLNGTMTDTMTTDPTGCWLFDNKAKDSTNRRAYFNSGANAVELSGTGAGASIGNYWGAAYWNGSSQYFKTEAITANANESDGWTSDNLSVTDNNSHELWKDNIKSLTYFKPVNSTPQYLFAGFDKNHNDGGYKPYNISTYPGYEDTSLTTPSHGGFSASDIMFLRNIDGTIYMSVYTEPAERCGLWAYYPDSKGWNIE